MHMPAQRDFGKSLMALGLFSQPRDTTLSGGPPRAFALCNCFPTPLSFLQGLAAR